MTPPDATPEAGPRSGQPLHGDGPAAVADFAGLDSDDGAVAPVATFDDLDGAGDTAYVPPDLLGRGGADRPVEDGGSPEVRVASFDGPSPRSDRSSSRARRERPRTPTRRAAADGASADVAQSGGAATVEAEPGGEGPDGRSDRTAGPGAAGARDGRRERRSGGSSRAGRSGGLSFSPQDDDARAKEICLRLLTDRSRTVAELSQALRRKEIPDEVARRVLERFDEVGLVDDEAFAGQWVRSRHRQRGLGRRAIAAELHRKGVAKEIADEALTEIDAESEGTRARELVDRKLRTVAIATKEQRVTAARRLVGMLARKGYGGDIAYRVVREAIAEHGAEEDELGEGPLDD